MKWNSLFELDNNTTLNSDSKSLLSLGIDLTDTNIYTMKNTKLYDDVSLLDGVNLSDCILNDVNLIILTEPKDSTLDENKLNNYIMEYQEIVTEAKDKGVVLIHIISNKRWYMLFQQIILLNNIPLYLTNTDYKELIGSLQSEELHLIDDYLYLSDFHTYTNNIDDNLLIDLTMYSDKGGFYNKTINTLFNTVAEFEKVTILINSGSYFPNIYNEKIDVISTEELTMNILRNHSYVFILTNKPYDTSQIYKVMYYAANSKIVYSNYNFKVNNILPSIILNLTENLNDIKPLNYDEAFDIMNENRNTVMYNHTFLSFLDDFFKLKLNQRLFNPLILNSTLPNFDGNSFIEYDENLQGTLDLSLNDYKYDLEKTLAFPLIFMNIGHIEYQNSYLKFNTVADKIEINLEEQNFNNTNQSYQLSVIVPIHNNGRYLKYKCFSSLKRLKCFNDLEIIFVDDGSTDNETLRIIEDIRSTHDIVYKRFETGSGSASRPRNEGVYLSTTDLITYLDPDNEAVDEGYSVLLNEINSDSELDMVVGNIIREDNEKRNSIRYSTKIIRALNSDVITNTRDALIKTNLTVQSIQGLIVKKNIITENHINMVEEAAGQDTLYFQQLLLNCEKVKVVDHMIHSYYAFVEGSITNTVTHKFFEKFYKVEQERIKFLIEENLIEEYMDVKFNQYITNWYMLKLEQVEKQDYLLTIDYLIKIIELYKDYSYKFDDIVSEFYHSYKVLKSN